MAYDYYNPASNYGLAQDWRAGGFPTRREFVQKVRGFDMSRPEQNKLIRNFWGPGGRPAFQSPFGKTLADEDPVGTFYRHIGALPNNTTAGMYARNQYDEVFNAFRAAKQRNPLLRFDDFLNRSGILNLIDRNYQLLTPQQRGEQGPLMMQRFL